MIDSVGIISGGSSGGNSGSSSRGGSDGVISIFVIL